MTRPLRVTFGPGAFFLGASLAVAGVRWYTMWGLVLWAGVCAALGRAAVVTLVTVHDDPPSKEAEPAQPAATPLETPASCSDTQSGRSAPDGRIEP
ncbi:hypothetical protein [Arthrobacter sp. ZGTC412]|uniref:hypothetical protein n=1 Tax=Arthrobacter sp. ZGTC412 TaxID=2058900 RepID=UPI000CE568F9|nr:hypothetical protein [Arthrobacter sp. ZGTC412]